LLGHQKCEWLWGFFPASGPLSDTSSNIYLAPAEEVAIAGTDYGAISGSNTIWHGNWSLQTADGSMHPIGNLGTLTMLGSAPSYYEQASGPWETLDATGWRVNGTFNGGSEAENEYLPGQIQMSIIDPDGVAYGSETAFEEDPNGNMITLSGGVFTDSLGRQIPSPTTTTSTSTSACPQPPNVPLSAASATLWSVPGPDGATEQYTFCYANVPINIAPYQVGNPAITGTISRLQSIVLPNSQSWDFQYIDEDGTTYDGSPVNYDTLSQITLPTGGTISYTYTTTGGTTGCQNEGRWVASRTVNANDGTGSHTWTYSYAVGTSTTVTDPLGNYVVHTFSNFGDNYSCSYYETQAQYYQSGGTLLKTVNTSYSYTAGSGATTNSPLTNVVPTQITTVWPNGKTSSVTKSYDSGFSYTGWMGGSSEPGIYGKETSASSYDFGQGGAGALLETTNTNYFALSNPNYLANNLLNLVYSRQVLDSGGTQRAYVTYGFDESSPASSGISTQHSSSPPDGSYRGNQTSVHQWLNTTGGYLVSTATFFDTGTVDTATDPKSNTTTFAYSSTYAGAFPTSVTNALNQTTTHTYDIDTGLLTSTIDPNIQTTSFTFDEMWRPLQTQFPDGGQKSISYQDTTFPVSVTVTDKINSSQSVTTTDLFDGVGRLSQSQLTSDPSGTVYVKYTYDADGRKYTVSNPYRTTSDPTYGLTTYLYDGLGRSTQVIPPDGSPTNNYVLTQYCGNETMVTDQSGHWRRSMSDGLGRLTEVDEPNSLTATVNVCPAGGDSSYIWATTYAYDALSNLSSVVQNSSRQRSFVYDSLSRLVTSTNPEPGTVTYTYDSDGNMATKVDARSITTTYAYDAVNRTTSETYSNGDPTVSYTYDQTPCLGESACYNIGRRTSMTDAAGSEAWSYDTMGRTLTDQRTTNSITKSSVYTYNYDGSPATLTYPSGRTITYTYDNAQRALTAEDTVNGIDYATGGAYTPQGTLQSLTLGYAGSFTGVNLSATYNTRLQPQQIEAWSTASTAMNLSYNFVDVNGHNNGNVMGITNNLYSARSQTFTYDQVNRIYSAQASGTSGANCWKYNYGYDAWGNLLTASAPGGFTCSESQLSLGVYTNNQVTNTGFSYDASGNELADGSYTYAWNAESEIKTAASVNYLYDGDGDRVEKSNGKIYWYGAGDEILDESDLSGNITDEYVFFGGRRVSHRVVSSGNIFYYVEDFLGSSRVITQSNGAVCYDADFLPYGAEIDATYTCASNYKFEGKERDAETGNDDFGARYYSSNFGRWLSPDWSAIPAPIPYADITNPQTLNLYSMVENNPETFADVGGHLLGAGPGVGAFGEYSTPAAQQLGALEAQNEGDYASAVQATEQSAQTQTAQAQNPTAEQVQTELTTLASAYGVPVAVVLAVAQTESDLNVNAEHANKGKDGTVTTSDYGLMEINSTMIGRSVTGPDGKSFTIPDSVKTDWKDNANAGVALVAQNYKAAVKDQPNGTAQTRAQQTYSAYNGGPGERNRYAQKNKKGNDFKDERDKHFLNNYRAQSP
jgi:RHS repeat-associated protein